jgi:hypothetical protein
MERRATSDAPKSWKRCSANGLTGRQNYLDKLGIQYPANVEMPDLANDAIQKAMNLKNLPKDATFANRLLYAPEANDPGIVDYIGWSFDLFGFRVESFYYFYFLVLSIAIVLFLICFWADALPLLVLAGVMVAFLFLVDSHMFDTPMLRTVHNQRFLGTLCIVSYLHLLFSILVYRRPTPLRVVLTLLQAAVFIFVMFTRSSAFWLILAVAIIIALHVYYRAGRPADEPRKANAARLALSWPALVIVAGLAGSLIYKSAVLHPIYSIGIFLPYHMIWHNAYMGMGLHPDWETRGDKRDGKPIPGAGSDNSAWIAALDDAEKRYGLAEIDTVNGRVGGLPGVLMALHEKLIKERFLALCRPQPALHARAVSVAQAEVASPGVRLGLRKVRLAAHELAVPGRLPRARNHRLASPRYSAAREMGGRICADRYRGHVAGRAFLDLSVAPRSWRDVLAVDVRTALFHDAPVEQGMAGNATSGRPARVIRSFHDAGRHDAQRRRDSSPPRLERRPSAVTTQPDHRRRLPQ